MCDCEEPKTVNNHVDDTTCLVTNPSNPKEPKLLEDELWDDYVTLAEFKMHDEEMTRSKQRHYLDVPILEFEELAHLFGADHYLSVRTGGFINISGFGSNGNDHSFENHIKNDVDNSEDIDLNARTEFSNENLSYVHLLAENPAKSDLLKLYYKAARKRSLPAAENITTLRETSTEWDKTTRRQFHTIGRALKHCAIEDKCKSIFTPSNIDDESAMSLISLELVEKLDIPIITLKEEITINAINKTKSQCTTFAYVQIRLDGQSKDWRAILLCTVMKDPSVPLLIGSNDLSAYKMTPIPYAHSLIVGDFLQKNEPIEFSGSMPYQDWNVGLKAFQHQQATVKEIEKLIKTS